MLRLLVVGGIALFGHVQALLLGVLLAIMVFYPETSDRLNTTGMLSTVEIGRWFVVAALAIDLVASLVAEDEFDLTKITGRVPR